MSAISKTAQVRRGGCLCYLSVPTGNAQRNE